ncbi:Ig-like domain-containing protein [Paenibacillus sp. FA6]|uniref:Ig-like domain-containing protein n=1 Tax=Paenibacillus sp. FA6 TaxID=3413029 RepID=UPI003F65D91E
MMSLILIISLASAGTSWAAETPNLIKLEISKNELFLEIGGKETLTVTASYDNDTKKNVIITNWVNKDDTIATISNGTVTARKEGTTTITGIYGDKETEKIEVNVSKKVKSLTKSVQSLELRKNDSKKIELEATYVDYVGSEVVTDKANWSSSNDDIATVINGNVKAQSAGVATITASYGNQTVTLEVTVENVKRLDLGVDRISLLIKDPKDPKDSQTVTLTATYPDGSQRDVAEDAKWTTSNKNVADVIKGKITAYGAGTATITASYGAETVTLEVDVDKTRKLVVDIQNVYLSLVTGGNASQQLALTAVYPDSPDLIVTKLATWTSSNESVAYVNKEGVIYAEGVGSATITGKYGDKSVTVQVDVDVPRHLDLEDKVGMSVGDTKTLELHAAYADITGKTNVADKAAWSSSDAAVVFVSNGKLTAYKKGEATVSAIYGGITVTTKVSVDIPVSISLDAKTIDIKKDIPYPASLIAVHDTKDPLKNIVLTSEAEWSTSDEKIAEVDSDGLITGVATGTATITALYDKTKYTMKVNVGLVKELEADTQLMVLSAGESKNIELTAKDSSGNGEVLTGADVTWKSSSPSVAAVKEGKVTGYTKGKATITAEYGGQKVTVSVEVDMVQSIEASHQSVSLKTVSASSKEEQVNIIVTFSDGSTKDVTDLAEWKTGSYKIATVNKGKVTAAAYGKTKVTAKYAGKSISIPVDVDMLKYLQTDKVSLKMTVGQQADIIATATFTDGSEDNVSKAALWTSSKILAVSVKDGKIKANGKGKATITVSYGGKKTKVVIVVE